MVKRVLPFTKTADDTGIRVVYTDNRGCFGNNVACQWEIRFDDNQCSMPGNLAYVYYSDHACVGGTLKFPRSETVVGTCFGLPADDYEIQVWIASVPGFQYIGDFHTGGFSYWALEAEEVN